MQSAAASLIESLLTAALPPRCALCDEPLLSRQKYSLCRVCLDHIEVNGPSRCGICDVPTISSVCASCATAAPAFSAVVAPYLYGGAIADLITAAKFKHREDLAVALGRLLADHSRVAPLFAKSSVLVPVPLGWHRRFVRGFNQSAVIARAVGCQHHVPVLHGLVRLRNSRPQSDLLHSERSANVDGVFAARCRLHGRCVLVDDVVTSGETARQAALALRAAGADEVIVLAVARTALAS